MPERKWGQDAIEHFKKQFHEATGVDYQDAAFQSPDATPPAIRSIVAAIKVLEASGRQLEIIAKVQRFPKAGDVHVIPDDKKHLLDEHAKAVAIAGLWSSFQ